MGQYKQKNSAGADVLTSQMRIDKAKRDILTYRQKLRLDRPNGVAGQQLGIYHRTVYMGNLAEAYKEAGDIENMKWCCQELIAYVKQHKQEIPGTSREPTERDKNQAAAIGRHFKNAHFMLAPYSFHHFLLCLEWNIPPEMKFYTNRFCVMKDWVQYLQDLDDGNLEILTISCPPRVGKTGLGTLWFLWSACRHPDKSLLFVTHTSGLANKVFEDVLKTISDPSKEFDKIFPGVSGGYQKSAEYCWIDLPAPNKTNYKTMYFRGIDGALTGFVEASWAIYMDDVIKNLEEAMNPQRLENAWSKVSVDVMQRKTNSHVKLLSIATKWSTRDPISRIMAQNEGNPKAKFIRVPGLNADGESNFNFPYNPLDKAHFEALRATMDPVSFATIVQQEDMERDGLVFDKENFCYYEGTLPGEKPDLVCAAVDVALGGGDSLAMPVAYLFGKDVYIADVIHNRGDKQTTMPMIIGKVLQHSIEKLFFEFNSGGDFMSEEISRMLKSKGYRCNVTGRRAPTNQSKLQRILSVVPELTGSIQDGSGYRFYFLSEKARKGNPEYISFMNELYNFSQMPKAVGKQKDDAPDSLATLCLFALPSSRSNTIQFFSRAALAI